jgi:hypothetical protein
VPITLDGSELLNRFTHDDEITGFTGDRFLLHEAKSFGHADQDHIPGKYRTTRMPEPSILRHLRELLQDHHRELVHNPFPSEVKT